MSDLSRGLAWGPTFLRSVVRGNIGERGWFLVDGFSVLFWGRSAAPFLLLLFCFGIFLVFFLSEFSFDFLFGSHACLGELSAASKNVVLEKFYEYSVAS